MNVLIIDDERDVRQMLKDLISSFGHVTHTAGSAAEGLERIASESFDAVICDIRMPGMDGMEFLARVRDGGGSPPVILLTAHADMETAMNAVRLGAFDYLTKPVDGSRLGTSLLRLKYQQHLQEQLQAERIARARMEAAAEARQESEAELRESERRYRAVVEDLPVLVCRFRAGGEITFVNDNYCRYFGKLREELIGMSFLELIPEKDRAEAKAHFEGLTPDCPTATYEHRVVDKDGGIKWQRWTDRAITDETGRVVEYQSIGEDITEYKRMQEHVRHVEKMQAIGQLAAGVAHEINNPISYVKSNLGTLDGYAKTLCRLIELYGQYVCRAEADDPQGRSRLLKEISELNDEEDIDFLRSDIHHLLKESGEGAERVRVIVQSLKSFARADENEKSDCDLVEGIESTLRVVWNELKYRCEVVKDFAPLPLVRCNAGQINQVFMNLLVNASHAMPEGGTITITAREEDGVAAVSIADTGVGIDAEHLPRIFEPFFTTKEVGKGTGLGLSISHGIVTEHGGTITVESDPGKGTTFTVRLPIGVTSDADGE